MPDETEPASLNPPRSLHIPLPAEIVAHIATYLDRSSILSLAQVSHRYRQHLESQIWAEIHVKLPDGYYVEDVQPDSDPEGPDRLDYYGGSRKLFKHLKRLKEAVMGAEWVRGRAARMLVEEVLESGNERRWGLARRMRLEPRKAAMPAMVKMMRLASPNLRTLEIDPDGSPSFDEVYTLIKRAGGNEGLEEFEIGLESRMLDRPLSFPALTTVRLGYNSIRSASWLECLFDMAPNLTSFDLDVNHGLCDRLQSGKDEYPKDTKLQRLRLSCRNESVQLRHRRTQGPPYHIITLLKSCPQMRQLSIIYNESTGNIAPAYDCILDIISTYRNLQDLHWPGSRRALLRSYWDRYKLGDEARLPTTKRIVLPLDHWHDIFKSTPASPHLEILHFLDPSPNPPLAAHTTSSPITPGSAQLMTYNFALDLKFAPKLRVIHCGRLPPGDDPLPLFDHLDDIEASGFLTGYIRSYLNRDEEVLHARLLLQHVEVSDEPHTPDSLWDLRPPSGTTLEYRLPDESRRIKTFELAPSPAWYDFTYYEGVAVPMEILEEMRVVEGASVEHWDKRGVEVGDEAWDILMDWQGAVESE